MSLRRPWLKHYPADVPADVAIPAGPLDQLLQHAAAARPDAVFLDFFGRTFTYGDIWAQAQAFAAALQARGFKPGQRVALCLPNMPFYVIAYYGVLRAGGVVVNLNPMLTPQELTVLLADSRPAMVVTTNLSAVWPKVQAALKNTSPKGAKPKVLFSVFTHWLPWHLRVAFQLFRRAQLVRMPRTAVNADTVPLNRPHPVRTRPQQLALIQYTGGTTGLPKGAMLSHANLQANTAQLKAWLGEGPGHVFMGVLPLCHIFANTAILNLSVSLHARLVLLPMFEKTAFLKTLHRTGVTTLPGVPSLFQALLGQRLPHTLRYAISGGAPLPEAVRTQFETETNALLIEGYGLSEAAPVAACQPRPSGTARIAGVGLPLPGTLVAIHHPDAPHRPLAPGHTGEVWLSGPQIMQGYWRKPAETAQVLVVRHGRTWLRTGDVGHLTTQGHLVLTDRLKDVIISHGYKIYPRQIEDVLRLHPKVADVSVIAVAHPHKGEAPHAFITLKNPGAGPNETMTTQLAADIKLYARARLNALACPVAVTVLPALPRTPLGKVSKKELATMLANAP